MDLRLNILKAHLVVQFPRKWEWFVFYPLYKWPNGFDIGFSFLTLFVYFNWK